MMSPPGIGFGTGSGRFWKLVLAVDCEDTPVWLAPPQANPLVAAAIAAILTRKSLMGPPPAGVPHGS
jgi:hypothetical protein